MNRKQVYKMIDTEREYQERGKADKDKLDMIQIQMGAYLSCIRKILREAEDVWYTDYPENNYQGTMEYIRKIAGLCVSAGEFYGMPERKIT